MVVMMATHQSCCRRAATSSQPAAVTRPSQPLTVLRLLLLGPPHARVWIGERAWTGSIVRVGGRAGRGGRVWVGPGCPSMLPVQVRSVQ